MSVRAALIACVFFLLGAAPAWSQATADLPEGVEPMTFGVDTMTITTATAAGASCAVVFTDTNLSHGISVPIT